MSNKNTLPNTTRIVASLPQLYIGLAERGEPLPPMRVVGDLVGCDETTINYAERLLLRRGHIRKENNGPRVRIFVEKTGKWTPWSAATPVGHENRLGEKMRRCMAPHCRKEFLSKDAGHRFCGECRRAGNHRLDGIPDNWVYS